MIRPFDWRDFPNLHRNREAGIWLDTSLALTRWMALVPAGALLATFAPATGIYTLVASDGEGRSNDVVGQFIHSPGNSNAQLTFITPAAAVGSPELPRLLDHLAAQAGEHGAHNLLAEIDEQSPAFEVLRTAGFAIYARQHVWRLKPSDPIADHPWRPVREQDEPQVRHLYHSLVPALVQQTEPPPWKTGSGLVWKKAGELLAYVQLAFGPKGILAQPFVHPDIDTVDELMRSLHGAIPGVRGRPVYLCVRSYHAWLAPALHDLGSESGPGQAVMVKRLVARVKDPVFQQAGAGINAQPEISTFSHAGNHPITADVRTHRNRVPENV